MSEADINIFHLEPNEEYSERCGEVFLTNIGCMVFHCTLCDMKFKGFERFADHIRDEHLLPSNLSDTFLDSELEKMNCRFDYDYNLDDIEEAEETPQEIEIENLFSEDNLENSNKVAATVRSNNCSNENAIIKPKLENSKRNTDEIAARHIIDNLSNEEKESSKCAFRQTLSRFSSNIPLEERKYVCHICGASFKDKHNRNHHIVRHTDNKPFACHLCEKRFYTSSEVKMHLRRHTNERPFLCSECGHAFSSSSHFFSHIRRHKANQNQTDFSCRYCEEKFPEKSELRAHMKTHVIPKPFKCHICNATYAIKKSLKIHMKKHDNLGE